jgi:integrase
MRVKKNYPKHLEKRKNGTWTYRRAIPPDLQALFGAKEWSKSLKTTSIREAENLLLALDTENNRRIADARGLSPAVLLDAIEPEITLDMRSGSASFSYRANSDEHLRAIKSAEGVVNALAIGRLHLLSDDERTDFETFGNDAANLREKVVEISNLLALITDWESLSTPNRVEMESVEKLWTWRHEYLVKLGAVEPDVTEPEETAENPRILTALEAWLLMRSNPPDGSKPLAETANVKYRQHFKHFTQFHGNLFLKDLTPKHIVNFAEALAVSPNRKIIPRAISALPLPELIAYRQQRPEIPALGKVNENKVYDHFRAFFNDNGRKDLADAVPIRYIGKNERVKVKPLSPEHLRELFTALEAEHDLKDAESTDFVWWIKLMTYSGLRAEEAAQLSPANVIKDSGVFKLVIDSHDGRSLKNDAAHRMIPIHPYLVNGGFLTFVKAASGRTLLFGTFGAEPSDDLSLNPSRRLKRYLDKIDPHKSSAHRLRHSYIDALRNAKIDEATSHYLTGHTSNHKVHSNYGAGAHLLTMLRDVTEVDPLRDVQLR